jgi:hypothetical protein
MSDPDCSGKAPLPILSKAAKDARLLIAHVSREGREFDQQAAVKLFEAATKIEAAKNLEAAEEAGFWQSYSELVKLAAPARVDSLYFPDYAISLGYSKLSDDAVSSGLRKHTKTLAWMRAISVVAFLVTVALLAYLSITDSLITRNVELNREYQLLQQRTVSGTSIEELANRVITGSVQPSGNSSAQKPAPNTTSEEGEEPEEDDASARRANLQGLIDSRKKEIESSIVSNERFLLLLQPRLEATPDKPSIQTGLVPYNISVVSTQNHINAILANFALPTIAAVLGVTVFMLRTASSRITELSFKSNDAGVYWHRLVLGVVGGIAISWFTASDKSGTITSLTPAALAFLVGYSVEVLYNILDSIVKALGGERK